jgi:NAD(P)-dependent dehydrogenase (short-subunit alcohol dehydrogenase family)
LYDIDDQQVDLRQTNSWTMRLGEISTVEMIECHAINSFAPFVINSELKPMLMLSQSDPDYERRQKDGRYIVNVSAMEGQFYRHKTPFHPHTNMAKASMNMLTRTSAQDYILDGIYMNTVDTGWITDEAPVGVSRMYTDTPLDEWDAAMRILDPVLMGVQDPEHRVFGMFLKNYVPTKW